MNSTKNTNNNYGFYYDIENQTSLNGEDVLFLKPLHNYSSNIVFVPPQLKPTNKNSLSNKQINVLLTAKPQEHGYPSFLGIVCVIFTILNMFRQPI